MKLNKLLATLVILFACLVVYGLLTKISVQLGFSKWWQSYVSELVMVFCAIFIFRLWHSNILGIVQFMIQLVADIAAKVRGSTRRTRLK